MSKTKMLKARLAVEDPERKWFLHLESGAIVDATGQKINSLLNVPGWQNITAAQAAALIDVPHTQRVERLEALRMAEAGPANRTKAR